jgi:putative transposase
MSRSARGTVDEPGRNVAQKSGLNKAILDQGWGTFRRLLEYKQRWRGGEVIAVNPRYTSQTCPECGHVAKENASSKLCFPVWRVGIRITPMLVAAQNILALGHRERLNACSPR